VGQRVVRVRDPELVVEEVVQVKKNYPLEYHFFVCDELGGPVAWMEKFAKLYRKRVGLPFFCSVRANNAIEDRVKLLKEAGCYVINFALESANDHSRNDILKRNMSREDVVQALDLFRLYGLKVRMQNIIGLPVPDPIADAYQTLAFNHLHKPDFSWCSVLQAYPGTEIAEHCVKNGYVEDVLASVQPTFFGGSGLKIKGRAEIERLHKWWALLIEHRWLYPLRHVLPRIPLPKWLLQKIFAWSKIKANKRLYGNKVFHKAMKPY